MKYHFWRLLCLVSTFCMPFMALAQESWNPQANEKAIVRSGHARFTVLTPQMIRIQYSSQDKFEDRATFAVVNRNLPVPAFTSKEENGNLIIETSNLKLTYKVGGVISATDATTNVLKVEFELNGRPCTWYPAKDDALNLLGTNRTLDTAWGDNARDRLEKGLLSRAGWSILDESPATKRGDGSRTYPMEANADGFDWVTLPADKNAIDWYFMGYGHEYKKALYDFTRIAGKVPLPPKYIFGYWYSRYWAYSDADFRQIIADVKSNYIPMDVLIMDMDWHRAGWTGWSWNKNLLPDPKKLIDYMHANNLKTALNLHPADGVGTGEDHYVEMKADLGSKAKLASDGAILWTVENYDFMKALFKNIIRPLENDGVDFWWLDWQQKNTVGEHATERHYTCPTGLDGLGETFWCNHTFFQDMQKNRTNLRPVIYHRWGGIGSHRYPICFSGDTWAAWSTLAYEIFFTSNASNVCYTYWGHDLGGHLGGNNDPELMLRWLQFGAYTPIFRTHATNDGNLERRIWKYSNKSKLIEAVRQRYRMAPYLYTAARETYDTGVGMDRPLYYDYPEDANAYLFEDEFMFGNDMLVAPIYTPCVSGKATRNVWLPEGRWFDVTQNKLVEGESLFAASVTKDQFPVYYKAGSIIPFFSVNNATRTITKTPTSIQLKVVPGSNGEGRLYEDEGDNQNYLNGAYTNTRFTQTWTPTQATVTIEGRKGTFEGMVNSRTYEVIFMGQNSKPLSATVNGEAVTGTYSTSAKTFTIKVAISDLAQANVVTIETEPAGNDTNLPGENDWEGTAIENIDEATRQQTNQIYNISGQRIRHMQHGVNIVDKKKVIN